MWFFASANDHILVAFLIETNEAVNDAEKIGAVSRVGELFIGPADHSIALGRKPIGPPSPNLNAPV